MKRTVVLAILASAAAGALAQECRIEYQRADNAMAAAGRPDGQLGTETLTLKPGQRKVFNTDWKFEKRRNDGTNYYGSHMRILRNTGGAPVRLSLKGNELPVGVAGASIVGQKAVGELKPGGSATQLRHDLEEVICLGSAKPPTPVVGPTSPSGLVARQVSPDTIVLNWQPVAGAREYRVYVDPPPSPTMAGKPSVVGGNGSQFVIPIRNVAPGTVYRAGIEAIGANGAASLRALFPPIAVAGGPATGPGPTSGGGSPSGGPGTSPSSNPASSGQQCPAGQFMTGIQANGRITCAPPR